MGRCSLHPFWTVIMRSRCNPSSGFSLEGFLSQVIDDEGCFHLVLTGNNVRRCAHGFVWNVSLNQILDSGA